MKKLRLIVLLTLLTFMSGCGYKEGVHSAERTSYLYFTGNAKGAEVHIDDTSSFIVEKIGVNEQYKVAPGKHVITITKDGNILVKRELLLGDGIAREINVP